MQSSSRVAVILVNHKDYARKHLFDCYASLRAQTYPPEKMRIFIVDNGFTPETQKQITDIAPGAVFLANAANLGWGGGNNTALRKALKENFDYFVMLNMDTEVQKDWLEQLAGEADRRADLHILQSKVLLSRTDRINSVGNRMQFLGYGYCNGYGRRDSEWKATDYPPMDFASGAAMLVKREVFERVGLFYEEYFMYYDDAEFCWRARLAGFRVGLAAASVCHHKYDFRRMLGSLYYLERNRLLTLLTLEKWKTLLLILPCLAISETVLTLYFLFKGWGGARLGILRYFLDAGNWRRIFARRRTMRALRRLRDADVPGNFAARIVFAEIDSAAVRWVANPFLWLYWNIVKRLMFW